MFIRRTLSATVVLSVTAIAPLPAAAAPPAQVPPWPVVTDSVPAGFVRPATVSAADYTATMRTRLVKRVRAAGLGGDVSVRVEDLATGEIQFRYNSVRGRVPASTQKTATALAVLSARGPDSRMPTRVLRSADGLTLTIVGGGDPLLGGSDLAALAERVATKVQTLGEPAERLTVRYDDSLFASPDLPPGWYPSYFWNYATKATALTRDLARTSDPSLDAAKYFRRQLKANGLRMVRGAEHGLAPRGSQGIARFRGHSIAEAVWPMMQYSDNSIAEILLRHVSVAHRAATTSAGSARAVRRELAQLRVPLRAVRIVDGSGLSRVDRATAKTMVAITRASVNPNNPDLSTAFRTSAYPLAGVSGTLSSRFDDRRTRCAAGRIMAKTGTLSDTVALSGIASATDGRLKAFAILVNDISSVTAARYRVDRIAAGITGCR